jgi:hypothetical protein
MDRYPLCETCFFFFVVSTLLCFSFLYFVCWFRWFKFLGDTCTTAVFTPSRLVGDGPTFAGTPRLSAPSTPREIRTRLSARSAHNLLAHQTGPGFDSRQSGQVGIALRRWTGRFGHREEGRRIRAQSRVSRRRGMARQGWRERSGSSLAFVQGRNSGRFRLLRFLVFRLRLRCRREGFGRVRIDGEGGPWSRCQRTPFDTVRSDSQMPRSKAKTASIRSSSWSCHTFCCSTMMMTFSCDFYASKGRIVCRIGFQSPRDGRELDLFTKPSRNIP